MCSTVVANHGAQAQSRSSTLASDSEGPPLPLTLSQTVSQHGSRGSLVREGINVAVGGAHIQCSVYLGPPIG